MTEHDRHDDDCTCAQCGEPRLECARCDEDATAQRNGQWLCPAHIREIDVSENEDSDELPDGTPIYRPRPTRNERLQRLADAGCDTWEDARGER